jgi:hypothetical protein
MGSRIIASFHLDIKFNLARLSLLFYVSKLSQPPVEVTVE